MKALESDYEVLKKKLDAAKTRLVYKYGKIK